MNISLTLCRVLTNLDSAKVSASAFAFVANIPTSTLTAAFRGRLTLKSEAEAQLLDLSVRTAEVVEAIRPFIIERGDWTLLKKLVESEKSADVIRQSVYELFNE
jgi:hypothetical protein